MEEFQLNATTMITKANGRALKSTAEAEIVYDFFDSPIGPLVVAAEDDAIAFLLLPKNGKPAHVAPEWHRAPARLREARAQLAAYFAGKLLAFDLDLAPRGTEFQRSVWHQLRQIPYGDTTSYIELARRLGNPTASSSASVADCRRSAGCSITSATMRRHRCSNCGRKRRRQLSSRACARGCRLPGA